MKKKLLPFLLSFYFGYNGLIAQQNGAIDTSFNSIDIGFGNGDGIEDFGFVYSSAIQNDGKAIIGGLFSTYNDKPIKNILRLNTDGSLDPTFNPGTGPSGRVRAIAIQNDGKIIIGGEFTNYNGIIRGYIARINSNGSIDLSFNPGTGASNYIFSISIQTDGKIIIGGWFLDYNGVSRKFITRLNSDGSLDTSFIILGANNSVYSTYALSDGKIIVGGEFTSIAGVTRNRIARLNSDGTIDNSFNIGSGANNDVSCISIQTDEKILIGGSFFLYNGVTINRIARLETNGLLDTTFVTGTGASGEIKTIAIQNNGKIIISGDFDAYNGISRGNIARINSDGLLDTSFDPGLGASDIISSISIQNDEKIIAVGPYKYEGILKNKVFRINSNGTLDNSYNPGTGINGGYISCIANQNNKIIIAGVFDSYNGALINGITRLNSDGTVDTSFSSGNGLGKAINSISVQPDGKIVIGGYFMVYNGDSVSYIARLNYDGTLDTSFNTGSGTDMTVFATAIQDDGKILIGGDFQYYNGTFIKRIVRAKTDGSIDSSFNFYSGANNIIWNIAIEESGDIIAGGDFTLFNGYNRNYIARVNTNGTLKMGFPGGSGFNSTVYSIGIQNDSKILVGGSFTSYNGSTVGKIVRLNSNGTIDSTFNTGTGANNTIQTICILSDGKIIAGGKFTSFNGVSANRVIKLNSDGSRDTSFNYGMGADNGIFSVFQQNDGKIVIGGQFTSYNGTGRNRVARILNCAPINIPTVNNICIGDSVFLQNDFQTTSGTFYDTLLTINGCDSVIITTLFVDSILYSSSTVSICSGDSIFLQGYFQTTNGIYYDTLIAGGGCDSVITTTLNVYQSAVVNQQLTICDGDSVFLQGNYQTIAGLYYDTLQTIHGCDSITEISLSINPSYFISVPVEICSNDSILIQGNYQTSEGSYYDSFQNIYGCDSIIEIVLSINPSFIISSSMDICSGDSVFLFGNWQSQPGIYNDTLSTVNGCDSIIETELELIQAQTINQQLFITSVDSIFLQGNFQHLAGIYTDTFQNVNGCDSIIISSLSLCPSIIVDTFLNVTCSGAANGMIDFNISGGTFPYDSIKWYDAAGSLILEGITISNSLNGGTYTLVVIDGAGCISSLTQSILEPNPIVSAVTSVSNVTCHDSCDGSATVGTAGGTSPYSFIWSGVSGTATGAALCAGSSVVIITDSNGCSKTQIVQITEPSAISVVAATVDLSCKGSCDGEVNLNVSGGTAPYLYIWSPGSEVSASVYNLCSGIYFTTISDGLGCTFTQSTTVNEPLALAATTAEVSSTCSNCNGQATVGGSGGLSPYTYNWGTGQTGANLFNLCPGVNLVTITDLNGCSFDTIVNITDSPSPQINGFTLSSPSCNGMNNGAATVNYSGGTGSISIIWGGGQTTATIGGLSAGTYLVIVNDANLCSDSQSVNLTQPSALTAVVNGSDSICYGQSDQIWASGAGGTLEWNGYAFVWQPSLFSGSGPFSVSPIETTSYCVTVTDANSCSASDCIIISVSSPLNVSFTTTPDTGNGIGTATAIVSGGNGGPYIYKWSDGTMDSTVAGPTGLYSVIVSDGCSLNDTATVEILYTKVSEMKISAFDLQIIPNPNDGSFEVHFSNPSEFTNCELRVYNMLGEIVYQSYNSELIIFYSIDISKLGSGMYYVRMVGEEGTVVKKVMVEK